MVEISTGIDEDEYEVLVNEKLNHGSASNNRELLEMDGPPEEYNLKDKCDCVMDGAYAKNSHAG